MATDSKRDRFVSREDIGILENPEELQRVIDQWERVRKAALKRAEETVPTVSAKDAAIVAGIAEEKLNLLRDRS